MYICWYSSIRWAWPENAPLCKLLLNQAVCALSYIEIVTSEKVLARLA